MDLHVINNSVSLLRHIFDNRIRTVSRIETIPGKPVFQDAPITPPLPRATPESKGVPSGLLTEYFKALADAERLDMHSVTVMRDGAVIAETDFGAYDRRIWHVSHSAAKSVTGLAVGMLVDEGKLALADRVVKLLEDRAPKLSLLKMKDITVAHLLTMTSGVLFNEAGAVTETDWVRGFLESSALGDPGEKFSYNSMNSYILSAIVRQVSGMGLMDYLRPRLWEPLGITRVYWETCPMGIEKGGWGLYLRQEDFAKIGQMVLQNGMWNGRRIVSEEWIKAATSPQAETSKNYGNYSYGYQMWVDRQRDAFLFNGMFGQNVLCYRDLGIIIATNAGIDEVFQQSEFYKITDSFFDRSLGARLPENPKDHRAMLAFLASQDAKIAKKPARRRFFKSGTGGLPEMCGRLAGRKYTISSPNRVSAGLMPLVMQAIQNIYTKGLVCLSFSMEEGRFFLNVEEEDAFFKLPVGFGMPEYTEADFNGEPHRLGITGRFAKDEDDRDVLIVRVSFLEFTSARHIRLYFSPGLGTLSARWRETPGRPFLEESLTMLTRELKTHPIISGLLGKASPDYIQYKLSAAFEPEFTASVDAGPEIRRGIV